MADNMMNLPPEYATQLAEILRRQQFASQMQQQAFAPKQTEMVSGIAVKNGGLNPLLQALTGYMANKEVRGAQGEIAGVQQKYASDQEAAIRAMQGMPNIEEQIRYGQTAGLKFPAVGAMAKALTEKRLKLAEKGSDVLKEIDPMRALETLRTEQIPGADYRLPAPKEPEFGSVPGPNGVQIPTVKNYNQRGVPTASFGPGAGTTIQMPGKEADMVLAGQGKEIEGKVAAFDAAKSSYLDAQRAMEAIQAGADAGGGAAATQWLRKAYQFLGGDPKNLTETTNLEMALGGQVLENARKLAPVTEVDLKKLESILGAITTDPQALAKGLAYVAAKSAKTMHDFHSFMDAQTENVGKTATPAMRDALQANLVGRKIGREAPDTLFGPQLFQLELARNLAKEGFDLNRLRGIDPGMLKDLQSPDRMKVDLGSVSPAKAKAPAAAAPAQIDPKKVYTLEELRKLKLIP